MVLMPVIPAFGRTRQGDRGIQGHSRLHCDLKASLGYRRPGFFKIKTSSLTVLQSPLPTEGAYGKSQSFYPLQSSQHCLFLVCSAIFKVFYQFTHLVWGRERGGESMKSEDNFWGWFSLSTIWVPGIELGSADLTVNVFTLTLSLLCSPCTILFMFTL